MKRVRCSHLSYWTIPNIQNTYGWYQIQRQQIQTKSNFFCSWLMNIEHLQYLKYSGAFNSCFFLLYSFLFHLKLYYFCGVFSHYFVFFLLLFFLIPLHIWQQSFGALIQHPFLRLSAPTSLRLQFLRYCILSFCVHEMKHKWKCENEWNTCRPSGPSMVYLWHQWHSLDISNTWYCVHTAYTVSNSPSVHTISWHVQNCEIEMCL